QSGHRLIEGVESQLGVPNQTELCRYVLVEVLGIERGVNDRFAGRHAHAESGERKAAADTEDHVGFGEETLDGARIGATAAAKRQRMVFGEGTLAFNGGGHRYIPRLCERFEFVPCLG